MQSFVKFILILLIVIFSLLPARENIEVLAVIEQDSQLDLERFESIEILIYHQFQHDMLVGLSSSQMIELNNLGIHIRIIDTQPWSENYFFLTRRDDSQIELRSKWGKEIYHTEGVVLVKAKSLPVSEITDAGFQVTHLKNNPYYLENRKVHAPPQELNAEFLGINQIVQ